jgi:hypothetical protein
VQSRLAPAVLDGRELRGRAVDRGRELLELHAELRAAIPDAAAEHERVGLLLAARRVALERGRIRCPFEHAPMLPSPENSGK